jgi:ABC-type iron transport system FetAB ATPase subunit
VSLLERLHAPTAGRILVDGVDVRGCTQQSLRRQVGTVMQDVHLFHDTVLANITYGTPGATRAPRPTRTSSSSGSRPATTPWWASAARACPVGRSSASRSRAPC